MPGRERHENFPVDNFCIWPSRRPAGSLTPRLFARAGAQQESPPVLDLVIGLVVGCAIGYFAREMLSRYRRERVRRERVEQRYAL